MQQPDNAQMPTAPVAARPTPATPAREPGAPGTVGGLPDDRTPLVEPRGPIDPKSAEGAGQVAQLYGAYLEERSFVEANALWGSGRKSNAVFAASFADKPEIHSEIGKPFDQEGAAGSLFTQVQFHLYGKTSARDLTWSAISCCAGSTMSTARRPSSCAGTSSKARWWPRARHFLPS